MGVHYFSFGYDENADICEELTPFQLMYIDNKLNGFVWQHNAPLKGFFSNLIFLFPFQFQQKGMDELYFKLRSFKYLNFI